MDLENGEPEKEERRLQNALTYIQEALRPVIRSNDYVIGHWHETFGRLPGSLGIRRKTLVVSLRKSRSRHPYCARLLLWAENADTLTACLDWPDDPHLGGLVVDPPVRGELESWLEFVVQEFARFAVERLDSGKR